MVEIVVPPLPPLCNIVQSSTLNKIPQFVSTILAGLGSFGLGNVMAWTSPALPKLIKSGDLGDLSTSNSSWIASLAVLGALISGPIAGWLINKFGRRLTMLALCLPFLIGWMVILFAQNVQMMYTGRFITGFAAGAYTIVITVYVCETIEDSLRGILNSIRILMLVSGMLFTNIVGAFVSWFWLTVACAIIPVVIFCGFLFLPESPRYLLLKNDYSAAEKSLKWLRGASEVKQVEQELNKIQDSLQTGNENSITWSSILSRDILKPTLICFCIPIFQQLGGINGVTFFTVEIFSNAGAHMSPNISTIIFGVVQVAFVFISLIIVNKIGRVILLASSFLVMCISLCALGVYFHLKEQNVGGTGAGVEILGWLPLCSLILYSIAFSIGAGPVPWLLMSEILPAHVKGHASGIITMFSWSLAFLATKTFQDLALVLGWAGSYWLYGGICIFGAVFTLVFVPETKGKTTEEIMTYFSKNVQNSSSQSNAKTMNGVV